MLPSPCCWARSTSSWTNLSWHCDAGGSCGNRRGVPGCRRIYQTGMFLRSETHFADGFQGSESLGNAFVEVHMVEGLFMVLYSINIFDTNRMKWNMSTNSRIICWFSCSSSKRIYLMFNTLGPRINPSYRDPTVSCDTKDTRGKPSGGITCDESSYQYVFILPVNNHNICAGSWRSSFRKLERFSFIFRQIWGAWSVTIELPLLHNRTMRVS